MDLPARLRIAVAATAVLGATATLAAVWTGGPLLVLPTIAVLAVVGILCQVISVRLTEGGSLSSVDFLPVLAATVVCGPAGAVLVAVVSHGIGLGLRRGPWPKATYNAGQHALSAVAAEADEPFRPIWRRCAGKQFDPRAVEVALDLDLPGDLAKDGADGSPTDGIEAPPRSKAGPNVA